ncbi:MAG: DUF1320 family protein [Sphingobacteriales bacterium]|nr:DUF1320 family protein [Sphingobacteriales bacterium]
MRYISSDDLKVDSQERFIVDSTADNVDAIDGIVTKVVEMVITYLSGRYNTTLIFDVVAPIRNEVLVDIIVRISLYKIFRRNPARKVSTDIKEDYDAAMKELERINSGRTTLANLPTPTTIEGEQPNADLIWGNTSNRDYYI